MSGSVLLPLQQIVRSSIFQQASTRAALVALLLFAGIPSALVILDRWFGNRQVLEQFQDWWCGVPPLCGLALPSYFLVVGLSTVGVILLVGVMGAGRIDEPLQVTAHEADTVNSPQRGIGLLLILVSVVGAVVAFVRMLITPGIPGGEYVVISLLYLCGWCLYSIPLTAASGWLRANARILFGYGLGLAAVSLLLYNFFARNEISLVALAVAALAAFVLVPLQRKIHPAFWLLLLALVVFSVRLNAWYYAFIGDEYAFFDAADQIVHSRTMEEIGKNFFHGTFVYSTQPYFASFLMAIPVKLFDEFNFGWRFGSIFASAVSIVFFYYFFRTFLVQWVALSAAFLISVSHYLMSFSRIGYNNTQVLPAMGMALAAAAWAIKTPRPFAFVVTGSALAFCFYIYPTGLYIVPVVLLLLCLYHPPRNRAAIRNWVILTSTVLLLVLPLVMQPNYWSTKLESVPDQGASPWVLAQRPSTQFGYTFFSFLYTTEESHFVSVAMLDPLTAALVLIGLGVLIRRLSTDTFARFVLCGLVLLILFLGATHRYRLPPLTRIFLLVPWFCLIAAIGLQWLVERFSSLTQARRLGWGILAGVLMLILSLNLVQAYIVSPTRSTRDQKFEPLLVRLSQNLAAQPNTLPQNVLLIYEHSKHHVPTLQKILHVEYLDIQIREHVLSANGTLDLQQSELDQPDQVVVISPLVPTEVNTAYRNFLGSKNLLVCQVVSLLGDNSLAVWYSPTLPSPCADPPATSPFRLLQPTWLFG